MPTGQKDSSEVTVADTDTTSLSRNLPKWGGVSLESLAKASITPTASASPS